MPAPLLNYLGPSASGGAPGMPAGVPAGPISMSPGGSPSAAPGPPQQPPALGGAGPVPGMFAPGTSVEPLQQYEAVAQSNGTVLLHIKNPDGSLGPAIQIIDPTKGIGGGGGKSAQR